MQPGFALATVAAPAATTASAFAPRSASGHLRLEHVVEAGRAAADVAVREVDDLEPGDRPEDGARLLADVLCPQGVTGVVVRHPLDAGPRRRRLDALRGEELHQVHDLASQRAGVLRPEQVADVLQVRAASGGVHDDHVGAGERAQVALGEPPRGVEVAVVRAQRAAAGLRAGDGHAPPVPRQHPDRGAVHGPVPAVLDAAGQQRDRAPGLALGLGRAREPVEQLRALRDEPADALRHARRARSAGRRPPARAASCAGARRRARGAGRHARAGFEGARSGRGRAPSSGRTARGSGTRPHTRGRTGRGP